MTLTQNLREELAHSRLGDVTSRLIQSRAMVHMAGRWHVRAQGAEVVVRCAHGAVMRRLRQTLVDDLGSRPDISRYMGTNLAHSAGWLVRVGPQELDALGLPTQPPGCDGVPDGHHEPLGGELHPLWARYSPEERWIHLGGAVMVAGSLNAPHAPVHFELSCPTPLVAQLMSRDLGWPQPVDGRIVIKKAAQVAHLLTNLGASQTLDVFLAGRAFLATRKQANRAANADQANLARITAAADKQGRAIALILDAYGWAGFPDDLRQLALLRYVNPEASLAELGALLVPPVDKATVHRRLKRILHLAVPLQEKKN